MTLQSLLATIDSFIQAFWAFARSVLMPIAVLCAFFCRHQNADRDPAVSRGMGSECVDQRRCDATGCNGYRMRFGVTLKDVL